MLLLSVFLVSVSLVYSATPFNDDTTELLFAKFRADYGRVYATATETVQRFQNFKHSLEQINKLNDNSQHAKFAINEFADLSPEEFKATKLMPQSYSPEALATACLANGAGATKVYGPEEIEALPTGSDSFS
jgi:hypothetical protein